MDASSKPPLDADHVEKQDKLDKLVSEDVADPNWDDPRAKKIKRKVDIRLSVILALMYIVNQIDRTNLPNA